MFSKKHPSIREEVYEVINNKLDEAQADFENECEQIDSDARTAKIMAKEKAVSKILSKLA